METAACLMCDEPGLEGRWLCRACRGTVLVAANRPRGVLPYLRDRWQVRAPSNSTQRERSEAFALYVDAAVALGRREVKPNDDGLHALFAAVTNR